MAEAVKMINNSTGISKTGFHGFSWTTFFFGPFPALFRADYLTFIGYFAVAVIFAAMTAGLSWLPMCIIWAFIYNGFYTKKLLEKGYTFNDTPECVNAAIAALKLDSSRYQPDVPAAPPSQATNRFMGEMSVDNDAYKLFLVKKYNIEKNTTLDKFVANEKLFGTVEEAIAYVDGIEKGIAAEHTQRAAQQQNEARQQEEAARQSALLRETVVEEGTLAGTKWTYRLHQDGSVVVRDEHGGENRYKSMAAAKAVITWWE